MTKQKVHTKDTPATRSVVVRLPAELREPLERAAAEERRSLTAQVSLWLSERLAARAGKAA